MQQNAACNSNHYSTRVESDFKKQIKNHGGALCAIPRKEQSQGVLCIQESRKSGVATELSNNTITYEQCKKFIERFKFHKDIVGTAKISSSESDHRCLAFSLIQTLNWCILRVENGHAGYAAIAPLLGDGGKGPPEGNALAKCLCPKQGKRQCHVKACIHLLFKTFQDSHYCLEASMTTLKNCIALFCSDNHVTDG